MRNRRAYNLVEALLRNPVSERSGDDLSDPQQSAQVGESEQITVKVTTKDGDSWTTGFNGSLSDAREYFLGMRFEKPDETMGSPVTSVELVGDVRLAPKSAAQEEAYGKRGGKPCYGPAQGSTCPRCKIGQLQDSEPGGKGKLVCSDPACDYEVDCANRVDVEEAKKDAKGKGKGKGKGKDAKGKKKWDPFGKKTESLAKSALEDLGDPDSQDSLGGPRQPQAKTPQEVAMDRLERLGFRFSNWIPAEPDANGEAVGNLQTAVMIKRVRFRSEYREVEPDGTIH